MSERFRVIEATVVDTSRPGVLHDSLGRRSTRSWEYIGSFAAVCMCSDKAQAERVAAALNAAESAQRVGA